MSTKKIVFAYFDEEYISTIECKIAKFIGQNVELEFLTDEVCIRQYFANGEKMDILVLPEVMRGFFGDSVNAARIFYLTEENPNVSSEHVDADTIYKYASIRYLVGKLDNTLLGQAAENDQKGTKLIGISSVGGGCGKTLSSMAIAYELSHKGNRVLYINTQPLQDFEYYLACTETLSDEFAYQCTINIRNALKMLRQEIKQKGFDYLPPFRKLPLTYQVGFDTYVEMIHYLKKKKLYDYIVIELSDEVTTEKLSFMQECENVVFVTTQEKVAVYKLENLLDHLTGIHDKTIILCNRFQRDRKNFLSGSSLSSQYAVSEFVEELPGGISFSDIKQYQMFSRTALYLE